MTHVPRIAHLRIALHVANPEVGNREGIQVYLILFIPEKKMGVLGIWEVGEGGDYPHGCPPQDWPHGGQS